MSDTESDFGLASFGAIDAVLSAYPHCPGQQAETLLAKAIDDSIFSKEDFERLFTDPERNPLPEAAARGYSLESVLHLIPALAMMLGRPEMRLTAQELKALWSRNPKLSG